MSGDLVDLSPGQLHKLADLIHRQEVQKLQELEFNSYAEQQKYLRDANDARDKVYHILDSARDMIAQTEAEKDATKQDIGKDVYDYCTKAIGISLQFIRSYNTRLTYLDKLKTHSDDLIKQLKFLNPATQQKEAQRLALEAGMYKKATLENAKKFQHFAPNQFSKWLKENKIMFEDLVQEYVPASSSLIYKCLNTIVFKMIAIICIIISINISHDGNLKPKLIKLDLQSVGLNHLVIQL